MFAKSGMIVSTAVALLLPRCAQALELKVDFGVGDVPGFISTSPNDVQAGFSDFAVDATENGEADVVDLAEVPSGVTSRVFDGVTVSVESTDFVFYDGPDEVHPLGDLGEDGVFGEADVVLRLADLAAGEYLLTTYHYASELITVATSANPVSIFLDAGGGESQVSAPFFPAVGELVAVPIPFVADGTQDVVVRLSGSGLINGFKLVPEPASGILLGTAAVGLCIACLRKNSLRRRRKLVVWLSNG